MIAKTLSKKILALPATDRVTLLDEIWFSLAGDSFSHITPSQLAELNRRWEEYQQHPETSLTWNQVKIELARRRSAKPTSQKRSPRSGK